MLSAAGPFGLASRVFDVRTILAFGVLGDAFIDAGIPTAPFIIGPMAETNLRRSPLPWHGDFTGFLTSPISGTFLTLGALSIAWQIGPGLRPARAPVDPEMPTLPKDAP